MSTDKFYITEANITEYIFYHITEEHAASTIDKYTQIIRDFAGFANGSEITKQLVINWENELKKTHKITSVNTMLTAVNGFFAYFNLNIKMKLLKIQKNTFIPQSKILTKSDYERLIETAREQKDELMALLMQTLGSTGIRIGELKFITVEAAQEGKSEVTNKSKTRIVFIPKELNKRLLTYAKKCGITSGGIFVTRSGKPLDRSNISRRIKKIGKAAGIEESKLFCHNFRRLFAVSFYSKSRDLSKLADLLGHSRLDTTRIYIMESGASHLKIIESMQMII